MKIKTNGIELNYTVEGEGPWLVMSHSLACDLTMWDEQAAMLRRNFKVLRFDTRGHGKSDAPEGYSVHRQERLPARFSRSFTLPVKVDGAAITASLTGRPLTSTTRVT